MTRVTVDTCLADTAWWSRCSALGRSCPAMLPCAPWRRQAAGRRAPSVGGRRRVPAVGRSSRPRPPLGRPSACRRRIWFQRRFRMRSIRRPLPSCSRQRPTRPPASRLKVCTQSSRVPPPPAITPSALHMSRWPVGLLARWPIF